MLTVIGDRHFHFFLNGINGIKVLNIVYNIEDNWIFRL